MQIEIQLFASLRTHRFKIQTFEFSGPVTVRQFLDFLQIPLHEVSIVQINDKRTDADSILQDQDLLSLFPILGGG